MDCAETEEELLDYHFGAGAQERRDAVRAHLRGCATCVQQFLDLKHDIDSGAAMGLRPSEPARARLRADVTALFRPSLFGLTQRWLAQPTPRYRAGVAMVAMLGVLLAVGSLMPAPRRHSMGPSSAELARSDRTDREDRSDREDRAAWQEANCTQLLNEQPSVGRRERRGKLPGRDWSPQVLDAYTMPQGTVDSARPEASSISYY